MTEEVMLREAIGAIRNGQRERARDLLTRLLHSDQENPEYWLWMSAVVESEKERIFCLKSVLRFDPGNKTAKQGLVMFGEISPDETSKPSTPIQRKWEVKLEAEHRPHLKINWTRQSIRITGLILVSVLTISLVLAGIFWPEKKAISLPLPPTKTPGPPPTYTSTPTYIGYIAPISFTATPVPPGKPLPLGMSIGATYTPTALFVNTPHAINEAYRAGIIAFSQSDWQVALEYFQQAVEVEPTAPDLQYYIGETQRMQKKYNFALLSYNRAIVADKYFAPAYLGRARVRPALDPKADILTDLDEAIANDPYYGEAYIERAAYYLEKHETAQAAKDLNSAQHLFPNSPLTYLYQAELDLQLQDYEKAFASAQKALDLDQTSLQTYWIYSQAALLNGNCASASNALETYLKYNKDDAQAWMSAGKAKAGICSDQQVYDSLVQTNQEGDASAAMEAFEKAIQLDSRLTEISLYRGIVYLEMGEGQSAVNELLQARKLLAPLPGTSNHPDPLWFAVNVGLSRALLITQRYTEANGQLEFAKNLAVDDSQKAIFYYWRAQINEGLNNTIAAVKDWKALIDLPITAYPADWGTLAQSNIATLTAPTLTASPTRTSTLKKKPSDTTTRTPPPSRTPTPTQTQIPSSNPLAGTATIGP
jgi:tetratricopeptide (TPR) repeat protein